MLSYFPISLLEPALCSVGFVQRVCGVMLLFSLVAVGRKPSFVIIRKLEPDTMLSNIVPLEYVELEYNVEW